MAVHRTKVMIHETWVREIPIDVTDDEVDEWLTETDAGKFWNRRVGATRQQQIEAFATHAFNDNCWSHPDDREPFFEMPNLDPSQPDTELVNVEADGAELLETY